MSTMINDTNRAAIRAELLAAGITPRGAPQAAVRRQMTKANARPVRNIDPATVLREDKAETVDEMLRDSAAWLCEVFGRPLTAKALWETGARMLPVRRAASEGMNSTGGVLVPSQMLPTIMAFRDAAVFRQNASTYTMTSDSASVARRTGGVTPVFIGENAPLSKSAPTWDSVGLTAKKLAIFDRLSSELVEDSAVDVAAYFLADSGSALGLKEDDCGFNGDGTSVYAGMRGICPILLDGAHGAGKIAAVSTHKTFGTLDATDIAALMAALPEKYWGNAKFYCSGYGAASLFARLGATGGGFVKTTSGDRPALSYGGVPIVITPKLPGSGDQTGVVMVLFGDLASAAALGSRREMTLMISPDRYLEMDQDAYRLTERFDVVCHNLGDNTNAGAIVALTGTA